MDAAVLELQAFLDEYFRARADLCILEAGCGSSSYLRLRPGARLIGLDVSEKQLARNELLHEKIRGDVQAYDFAPASFDMIVCWDVLEHLPHPKRAVERFFAAIKDDGLVVLAMPNVRSVKGQITKWTPHWFHVWVYRTLFGSKHAGANDHAPFKTYLRLSIAPQKLRRFAAQQGFSDVFFRIYESNTQKHLRARFGLVNGPWRFAQALTRVLSLGFVDPSATDYILVLKRSSRSA